MLKMSRFITPMRNAIRNVSTNFTRTDPTTSLEEVLINLPETRVTTLKNGMRVATENSGAPTATVGIWIDAGTRYETPENNGVAHFLEHMAFKGTNKRTQNELEMEIENMGAHLNAYTSREQIVFYAKCLAGDVNKSVEILSDIIQNSKLGEAEIERERSVILREMEEIEGNMQEVLFDHLHANAYQGTSLAQTILGPTKNIQEIQKKNLVEFIKVHYRPGRMVLAGSGGIDHDALVKTAESLFDSLPDNMNGIAPDAGHCRFTGSEVTIRDDAMPLAYTAVAIEGAGWTDPDNIPLMIASTLIGSWDRSHGGGANNASNVARVAYENNLCHSFQSFNTCYKDTGLWGMYFVTEGKNLPDFMGLFQKEWMRLCERVTDFEVNRAKNILRTNLLLMLDGTTANCEDIGRQMIAYGRRIPPAELDRRINDVTAETIRDVCYRNIFDTNPVVAAIGPTDDLPDYVRTTGRLQWYRT